MNRIVIDPDVCNGQPVIKGTRIAARTVLEFLAAGDSVEDVLAEYPSLTREDVLACIWRITRRFATGFRRPCRRRRSGPEPLSTRIRNYFTSKMGHRYFAVRRLNSSLALQLRVKTDQPWCSSSLSVPRLRLPNTLAGWLVRRRTGSSTGSPPRSRTQ